MKLILLMLALSLTGCATAVQDCARPNLRVTGYYGETVSCVHIRGSLNGR